MASVTVTSDGDYTIIVDENDSGAHVFELFEGSAANSVFTVDEGTTTTPPRLHVIVNSGTSLIRDGKPVTLNMGGTSGNTFELHQGTTTFANRVMYIDGDGKTRLDTGSMRLMVVANGSYPSSPEEGLVVLEYNSGSSRVRIAAYLNGAWRTSAWLN